MKSQNQNNQHKKIVNDHSEMKGYTYILSNLYITLPNRQLSRCHVIINIGKHSDKS